MKRCAAALLALLMLALAAALPAFAQEERRFELPEFDLPCRAAILVDQASGTVLYEKPSAFPAPTTRPWQWPSTSAGPSRCLWSR